MTAEFEVPPRAEPRRAGVRRRTGTWSLPEVRWAVAATALFLLGLATGLAGGPDQLWWAPHLACCAAGGWQPGWSGCARCGTGPWTWTC
ncbi:hypothetical protein [Saccharothrix lopnurensis]|uniref:Uncharacterized protein n=1 Tax=Saccharothrix lopnurensis TaxID=1670621 RepID=A0ABW1PH66_9PSEU